MLFKRGNESRLTYRLKWAAWEWLYRRAECRAIGFEVRLEGPSGRIADIVGIGPENRVYLIEVKSSRSDASRDDNSDDDLDRLVDREMVLEESVKLTVGILESAASHAQSDDPDRWRHTSAYRQAFDDHAAVVGKQSRIRERIATFSTKFHDPAYLRLAHCHYVMAPSRLLRPRDVPPMWGLLDDTPTVKVEAPIKQVPEATRHVLRAIARANTRDIMSAYGVKRTAPGPRSVQFPEWK